MTRIPLTFVLLLACTLFCVGVVGLLVRRNLLFMLISLEVMLNAAGLLFITAGAHNAAVGGQVMFVFILAVAAAEVALGLMLVFQLHRRRHSLDADAPSELGG